MNYIDVKNVKKSFVSGTQIAPVLKGITVSVNKGELCGIFGLSGSGKSTFLNMVGGLENYDEGKIVVDDVCLDNLSTKDAVEYRRNKIGFIFQFYNLVSDLTIRENILVGQYLSKDPLDIDELINTVGLTEHQNKYPSQVSGGQQQRCAIARALAKNPKVLLCDEPTGALDYHSSKVVLSLLESINKKYGTTILMVTHNESIKGMVDHVIKIHDGLIAKDYINKNKIKADEIE